MNYIRIWDEQAAERVDKFIANSDFVADRILKYYHQESEVIYPPIKTDLFYIADKIENYFLMVGRLLPYKKFDLAIEVFNKLGLPLKIVGDGPERKYLQKIAKKNIEFVGLVSDNKLRDYYAHCQAFIFPQEEDFGITAIEAMASGRPVIAYKAGGALEFIKENITGMFFEKQEEDCLIETIKRFDVHNFNPQFIRAEAKKFDKEIFKSRIKEFIDREYNN